MEHGLNVRPNEVAEIEQGVETVTLTPSKIRKTARELGVRCEVMTDVGMNHFQVHVTEGCKKAQDRLARYLDQRKPVGTSFKIVDNTPNHQTIDGSFDQVGDDSDSQKPYVENNVMKEIKHDGHKIVITKNYDLYVDNFDITEEYSGQPVSMAVIEDIKSRISAGVLLPNENNEIPIKNVSQLFNGTDINSTKTIDDVKQLYVDGEIGILELEDELEDVIELEYEPTAHPT